MSVDFEAFPPQSSAQAEIRQLDMPLCVDENVVGLDVAMDKVQTVHVGNGTGELGDVEASHLFSVEKRQLNANRKEQKHCWKWMLSFSNARRLERKRTRKSPRE